MRPDSDPGRLDLPALGNVHHRPNHADWFSALIADHITAVQNVGIGTIVPTEAVFVRPGFASAFNERLSSFDNPLFLLRMNPVMARFDPWLDLLGLVSEQGLEGLVPPELVCLQVPVPHRVVGRACDQLKTLLDPVLSLLRADALQGAAAMIGQRLQDLQLLLAVGVRGVALHSQKAHDLAPGADGHVHQRSRQSRPVAEQNEVGV